MGINALVVVLVSIILLVLVLVIYILFKLRALESKSLDVSARDIVTFVEQMREMVVESERAAAVLESSIREKESVLEDLSALVESRIAYFEKISDGDIVQSQERLLQDRIEMQERLEAELRAERELLQQQLEKERQAHENLMREKLKQERVAQEKILREEIQKEYIKSLEQSAELQPVRRVIKPITQSVPQEPVAGKAKIVAQDPIKTTEEVLRTRTEPILQKQVEDRIPSRVIKNTQNQTNDVIQINKSGNSDDLLNEDLQAEIYRSLLGGKSEAQIARELNISIDLVRKHLSLSK